MRLLEKVVTSALLLIVLPLIFQHDTVKAISCNYTIGISVSKVDARVPPYSNIRQGDTVCIEAGVMVLMGRMLWNRDRVV
jgi:hypothetical protein